MRSHHSASVCDVPHGDAAIGEAIDEQKGVEVRSACGSVGGEGRGERVGWSESCFFDKHIENNSSIRAGSAPENRSFAKEFGFASRAGLGSRLDFC